jgi:hypothetical protein
MALTLKLTEQEHRQNLRTNLRLARDYLLDAHSEASELGEAKTYQEAKTIRALRDLIDELERLRLVWG